MALNAELKENPGTIRLAINTRNALITIIKSPRVKMLIGSVRITNMGFTNIFRTPKTIATTAAVTNESIFTPGTM